jgi:hypothetical protein
MKPHIEEFFDYTSTTFVPDDEPYNDESRSKGHGNGGFGAEQTTAHEQPQRSMIQSSAEFVKDFVPPDYLLDGILQCGFFYSITGRTGSGKTAFLLLLAASAALGRPFGTREIKKGRVLYFAGENPDDVRMRWIALAQQVDFDVVLIAVDFIPGVLKISQMASRIADEVKRSGDVILVIVDTSAAYFEGDDENSNTQAGAHARRLRALTGLPGHPCVLAACHPVKNAADDNLVPRGGGAYLNEVDGNLTAANDTSSVEVYWQGKMRGPDFSPFAFVLRAVTHERLKDSKGRLIPTVIAQSLSEVGQEELANVARTNENRLLRELAKDARASDSELAARLGWFMKNGDPYKVMVRRTLKKLERLKLVTLGLGGAATLTPKGQKATELANG